MLHSQLGTELEFELQIILTVKLMLTKSIHGLLFLSFEQKKKES